MKPLARFLFLLCLLPGLLSGPLLPPALAGVVELVICADGGPRTIHLGADGAPVRADECPHPCIACGPGALELPPVGFPVRITAGHEFAFCSAGAVRVAPAQSVLFPAPRGPPMPV